MGSNILIGSGLYVSVFEHEMCKYGINLLIIEKRIPEGSKI
jgi:hypothetical protein